MPCCVCVLLWQKSIIDYFCLLHFWECPLKFTILKNSPRCLTHSVTSPVIFPYICPLPHEIRSFKPVYVFMPYINESNIQLPSCVASLQVASNVDVIVSYDASDQIRCGDAFSPLRGHKHPWCWSINTMLKKNESKWHHARLFQVGHNVDIGTFTCFLNVLVNILWSGGCVRDVVMGYKVYLRMWKGRVQTSSRPDIDFIVSLYCQVGSCAVLMWPLTLCFLRNSVVRVQGASRNTSST